MWVNSFKCYTFHKGILAPTKETIALIMKIWPSLASKIIYKAESGADENNLSESNVKFSWSKLTAFFYRERTFSYVWGGRQRYRL